MMQIIEGDFSDPRVVDLVRTHFARARAETAAGSAHVLDLGGLGAAGISFWTTWESGVLLGCGALKRLSAEHGEVKSMFTAPSQRRQGAGSAMLRHLIATARTRAMSRLSLETGTWDYFHPAHAFYLSHGFVACEPFADYVLDPNSLFLSLDLRNAEAP
jgi:putative acetyltransferase